MKKWIRWQGLIAFIIIGAALAGFWVFYLDTLVKHMIEKAGTAMVGAEVNVRSAKVMLVPLGIAAGAASDEPRASVDQQR